MEEWEEKREVEKTWDLENVFFSIKISSYNKLHGIPEYLKNFPRTNNTREFVKNFLFLQYITTWSICQVIFPLVNTQFTFTFDSIVMPIFMYNQQLEKMSYYSHENL